MDAQKKQNQKTITRRRFLSICAMGGTIAAMPWANAIASVPLHHWNGILLGANVSLTLAHPSQETAHEIFQKSVAEIKRLESIFTLYDSFSELSRLNKNGSLQKPSPEFLDIINYAHICHKITDGHFDITVKALEDGKTLDLVGMDKLHANSKEIRFKKHGMAITLNGIAQGYITDRMSEILKNEGLQNVLVELGEKQTIGGHPSGRPWQILVPGQNSPVPLIDKAIATSAARSEGTGNFHIFNPSTGHHAKTNKSISVIANKAVIADALSTGLMNFKKEQLAYIESQHPDIQKIYSS